MNKSTTKLICVAGFFITAALILKIAKNAIDNGQHVKLRNILMSAEFN